MKLFVALTDREWFNFLRARQPVEANFWQPSGKPALRAIDVGELLVFKLHYEADDLRHRIRQHATAKDFWTRFIAFSSSDESLNKAHVRYLESRLVALAKEANQWQVDNGNTPAEPPLSEADRAHADWFLQEMLVLYAVLGVDAFEVAKGGSEPGETTTELYLRERGAEARGAELKDGFLVRAGSWARAHEVQSIHAYMRDLRAQLLERGVLEQDGDQLVFTQDYRFSSPSTGAGVLVGGPANGRKSWKTAEGRTLKSIQDARAEAVTSNTG